MKKNIYLLLCCVILNLSCSSERIVFKDTDMSNPKEDIEIEEEDIPNPQNDYKILALGDSYTIGESVCNTCRFPEQLKDSLAAKPQFNENIGLKVIATTGWTTTNLLNAINTQKPTNDYDLATLLIGVNNQYLGAPFSLYESELPQLVDMAISKAKNNKKNVIVVSIPDYAFTPFGNGDNRISSEIDKYNTYAKDYCNTHGITYINITDITRMGFENPELVASDGLHPSALAYSKFVERILPFAIQKLKQ